MDFWQCRGSKSLTHVELIANLRPKLKYIGSTNGGLKTCYVTNPTAHPEEVEIDIEIDGGVLEASGPSTLTVGPASN